MRIAPSARLVYGGPLAYLRAVLVVPLLVGHMPRARAERQQTIIVEDARRGMDREQAPQLVRVNYRNRSPRYLRAADLMEAVARLRPNMALERVRRQAQAGWLRLLHFETDLGLRDLREAVDALAALQTVHPEACRDAAPLLMDVAFGAWIRARPLDAAAALALARALGANASIERYPPPFVRFAARSQGIAPQRFTVLTAPAGATVWVNCREVGKAPQQVVGLGGALVAAKHAEHEPAGRATLGTGSHITELRLERAVSRASQLPLELLRAAARALGASDVVLWRVEGARLHLRELGSAGNAPPRTRQLLLGEPPAPARAAPPHQTTSAARPPRQGRSPTGVWWLLGGSAALSIGATAAFFVGRGAAAEISSASREDAVFDDGLRAAEDRMDVARGLTYGCLAGAVLGAAGALTWWVMSRDP